MITYSQLGKKGRLGNQLFQIASTIALAKKHGHRVFFPQWKYEQYFEDQLPRAQDTKLLTVLKEQAYAYHEWPIADKDYDLTGWLQSEQYWEGLIEVKQLFRFKDDFASRCLSRVEGAHSKPVIAISIRRGDFITNPNYYTLPASYYIHALFEHFPDWQQDYNLLLFSDDIPYCKVHFGCLDNAYFADGTDIEQLCLLSLCDHFIISNSTFSWWGAYLGEKEGSKVIRPNYLLDGDLLKSLDTSTYWPKRWTVFDHAGKKFDFRDVTFTIPVKLDHEDRRKNVNLSLCLLQRDFNANYIVGEQGGPHFEYIGQWAKYINYPYEQFHRTKMLNEMAKAAETKFIVNWDADMICPPMQLFLAVEALRNGADMVYPYDGSFARVPRKDWFRKIEKHLDIGIVGDTPFSGKRGGPMPTTSVGGAVLFNKQSFIEGGMENEYMISYAPEDCERYDRFNMLGFKVQRVHGTIYHMDHFIGPDSTSRQPLFKNNKAEIEKIRNMNKSQLWEYVSTWPWLGEYNNAYYEAISPESIRSAKKVYEWLAVMGIEFKTVIDVGCGIGHWGQPDMAEHFGIEYWGIDSGVPENKLLIPRDRYQDIDLRKLYDSDFIDNMPSMGFRTFPADLMICLEVAEHLPESCADQLIKFLCGLTKHVLFSAAIPFQGGKGHVNEQFQTYWAEKFKANGYGPSKIQLREYIKYDEDIAIWYRQNLVLYERGGTGEIDDFIHPEMWVNVAGQTAGPAAIFAIKAGMIALNSLKKQGLI